MKFFRQTKESKRKLSFFLALAMVISLLPVTPVAKAAETTTKDRVTVNNSSNLSLSSTEPIKIEKENNTNSTGSAIITLVNEQKISKLGTLEANVITGSATTATAAGISIDIDKTTNKKVLVTVENIDLSVAATINISGNVTLVTETPATHTVTISSGELNKDIELTIDGAKATGTTTKTVQHNGKVTLAISSKVENAAISEEPDLTVGTVKKTWESSKAEITITEDTNIVVKGGKIQTVAHNTVNGTVKPDKEVADKGITEVSIDSENNASNLATNLAAGALESAKSDLNNITVVDENGKPMQIKKDSELYNDIIAALENSETQMTTSLDVKAATDGAVNTAKNLVNTTTIDNTTTGKHLNTLGDDIKAAVRNMLNDGVALDITLTGKFKVKSDNTTTAAITISEVKNGIKVTMNVPAKYIVNGKPQTTGCYYAIRIHNGKVSILPCDLDGNKISFISKNFSTYVISYIEGSSDNNNNNNNNNSGNNNNGYIPGPGTTSSSAPSANPSVTPSTNPSGAPSANPSGAPSANPSGAPSANPSSAPSANPSSAPSANPTNSPANPTKKPSTSSTVKVGKKATISGSQYKVTAVKGTRTVQFTKGKKNAKKIVIPSTVKVSGKKYKVTSIAKNALKGNKKLTKLTIGANVTKIGVNAFKGCSKLKSIIVKTKKLTKSKVGKNAFKGINSKATIKVPKAKVKAYKKIVQAKGAGKGVKVKK